ncbi:MAG TPA: PAS domain S-box protein [Candidatus Sabulitectum sp.]|nr:PAS domain S-box protein [Candidatus Sabulitectum sp.]HPJ27794.1 PAS domain S-box protein [Candidatus Sabulitectum sp.]HPR21662.1 PAS domain S-box protein [Candidatus Sabulitectum sp.]
MHDDLTRGELVERLLAAESALAALRSGEVDTVLGQDRSLLSRLATAKRREQHLKQVLHSLRAVSALLNQDRNRESTAREICRVLTGNLSYHNAWMVLLNEDGSFGSIVSSGFGAEFDSLGAAFTQGRPPSCTVKALDSSKVLVLRDPPRDCPDCPLAEFYSDRAGFTTRLRHSGRTYGVLSASVPMEFADDDEELGLFTELASDIAAGFYRSDLQRESALSEREKAEILDSISDAMITLDGDLRITYFNRAAGEQLGVDPKQVLGRSVRDVFPEGNDSVFNERYMKARESGEPQVFEVYFDREPYADWYDMRLFPSSEGRVSIYFRVTTERKRAEQALREAESRYRHLVENSQSVIYELLPHGILDYVSPSWQSHLGFSSSEAVGKHFHEFVYPEDMAFCSRGLKATEEAGEALPAAEFRVVHKNGSLRWFRSVVTPLFDDSGELSRFVGNALDVTEARAREERIRLLGQMLDSAPASITIHDTGGAFLYANRETLRLHGYEEESDFRSVNLHRLDVPESEALLAERFDRIDREGEASFEVMHYRKDGSTFPLHVQAKKISWQGKQAVLSIATDITERTLAERALHESEARFRALVEQSPYAIFLLQDGRYIYCNPAGARLLGHEDPSELQGVDPLLQLSPEYRPLVKRRMMKTASGESNSPVELKFIHPSGEERWSYSTSVSVNMNGRPAAIIVGQDITEKKRMERENRRLEERFQQFQRLESVGRLAGGVAHDLNNLLTPILGYGEMLRESLPRGRERENLEHIQNAGEKARELVQQLLAFSRRQTLQFRSLDINTLVGDFIPLLQRTITEDILIDFLPFGDPLHIMGDRGQLEQVLMNLAVNAQDAMPEGGSLIIETNRVEVPTDLPGSGDEMQPGTYASLVVSDTGTGMEPDVCSQVFEPFYTTKSMTEGTGLGLATVYGIVKQHDGYVWVDSVPGEGSRFSVYLPLLSGCAETLPEGPAAPGEPVGSETVLLVEDDDQVRSLACEILSRTGYRMITASSGSQALGMVSELEEPLHLLLTDVVMPGMNGRELYGALKETIPDLKVLYMSGYPDEVIASRGVVETGINFIQKPFSAALLASRVRGVLDSGAIDRG